MRLFRWERKISKERFEKVEEDLYELKERFEEVCKLLEIGFFGDTDYPSACFIDKKKKDTK